MKKILFTVLVSIFLFGCYTAKEAEAAKAKQDALKPGTKNWKISKYENVIIAKGVDFKKMVNTLLDQGYRIDKIDSNYLTLKTDYKNLCSNCLPEVMFDIRVNDTAAIFKGKWRSNGGIIGIAITGKDEPTYFDIMNEKTKVPKQCFNEMDRIARLLSNDVTYLKQ